MYQLVQFEDVYADEFTVYGWRIADRDDVDEWLHNMGLAINKGQTEFYFGTNEYVEYHNFVDFFNCLKIANLTDLEAELIIELFDKAYNGFIPEPDFEEDYV